jgi:hypothetical protein
MSKVERTEGFRACGYGFCQGARSLRLLTACSEWDWSAGVGIDQKKQLTHSEVQFLSVYASGRCHALWYLGNGVWLPRVPEGMAMSACIN